MTLGKMLPVVTKYNSLNSRSRHIVFFCKSTLRWSWITRPLGSNVHDILIGKLAFWIGTTPKRYLSTLYNHVLCIIFCGSKKHMIWIATPSIVAFMTHKKPIGYFSICKYPRPSMRLYDFTANTIHSPSGGINTPFPVPTIFFIANIYFTPKYIWIIVSSIRHLISKIKIYASAVSDFCLGNQAFLQKRRFLIRNKKRHNFLDKNILPRREVKCNTL